MSVAGLPFLNSDLLAGEGVFSPANSTGASAKGSCTGFPILFAETPLGDVPLCTGSVPFQNSFEEFLAGDSSSEESSKHPATSEDSDEAEEDWTHGLGPMSFWMAPQPVKSIFVFNGSTVVFNGASGVQEQSLEDGGDGQAGSTTEPVPEAAMHDAIPPVAAALDASTLEPELSEPTVEVTEEAAEEPLELEGTTEALLRDRPNLKEQPVSELEHPKREQHSELEQAAAVPPIPAPTQSAPCEPAAGGQTTKAPESHGQKAGAQRATGCAIQIAHSDSRTGSRKTELAFELRLRPVVTSANAEEPALTDQPDQTAEGSRELSPTAPATANGRANPRPTALPTANPVPLRLESHGDESEAKGGKESAAETRQPILDASAMGPHVRPAAGAERMPSGQLHEPPAAGPAAQLSNRPPDAPAEVKPSMQVPSRPAQGVESVPEWMPRPGAAPEVTHLRLSVDRADGTAVDIRIQDADGQTRVSVHTADVHYNEALRERVSELVHDIEQTGFRVESLPGLSKTSESQNLDSNRKDGEQPSGDQSQKQQHPSGGSDQRQRRQQDGQDQPSWSNEFESVFAGSVPSANGRR